MRGLFRALVVSSRLLQSDDGIDPSVPNNGDSEPQPSTEDQENARDAYEFVAFLLWYIFLVLCCVVPTCCAYRRRRIVEQRIALQQANMSRLQQSNLFILSNMHARRDGEQLQAERLRLLTQELKSTTMTIAEDDLKEKSTGVTSSTSAVPWAQSSIQSVTAAEEAAPASVATIRPEITDAASSHDALAYELEEAEDAVVLHLKSNLINGNRDVPGFCAICLCHYEVEEEVSWSPQAACQHAFHRDCILSWLSKKEEPQCPVCRQEFCSVPAMEEAPTSSNSTNAFTHPFSYPESFANALARSRMGTSSASNDRSASPNDNNGFILSSLWAPPPAIIPARTELTAMRQSESSRQNATIRNSAAPRVPDASLAGSEMSSTIQRDVETGDATARSTTSADVHV